MSREVGSQKGGKTLPHSAGRFSCK